MLSRPKLVIMSCGVAAMALAITVIAVNTESRPVPTPEPAATEVTYAFEPGMTRTYALTIDVDLQEPTVVAADDFSVSGTLSWTVSRVFEDGSADVDVTVDDLVRTAGGQDIEAATVAVRLAPDGRITTSSGTLGLTDVAGADPLVAFGDADTALAVSLLQAFLPEFPDDPIRPGDTWGGTRSYELPLTTDGIAISRNGTHEGTENTAFGQALRINNTFEVSYRFAGPSSEFAARPLAGDLISQGDPDTSLTFVGTTSGDVTSSISPTTGEVLQLTGTHSVRWRWSVDEASPITIASTMSVKLTQVD